MTRSFDTRIGQIQHLFETRAASPYDVDQEGNTMLHVSPPARLLLQLLSIDIQKACTLFRLNAYHMNINDNIIEIYLDFLRKLHDLCVPLNKTNALGLY